MLKTDYQKYIHTSRYARWDYDKGRRETWEETVDRFVNYFNDKYKLSPTDYKAVRDKILNLEVMPSMRALMTAGRALDRDNVAGYNCSALPVDSPRCFDEAMYILMCGTGVGFSVERQFINKMPEVSEEMYETDSTIVVSDSKIGWASSLRELISLLYAGKIPKWDVSKVRPSGSALKVFGGRASGPGPLVDLFTFVVNIFKGAKGRKLNSIECHDIMCKIGEVVVVGGVRRSALISLSNLTDDRMRNAKVGQWWIDNKQRALSNNSVAYTEKPGIGSFMAEWLSLYNSKSGERGIFNRVSAKKLVEKIGRRDPDYEFLTNPCCFSGDMKLLTTTGYKTFASLAGKNVDLINSNGDIVPGSVWQVGKKPVVEVRFRGKKDSIVCTPDHVFMTTDGAEVKAENLTGVRLLPEHTIAYSWKEDNFFAGFLRRLILARAPKVSSVKNIGEVEVYDFSEPETHWGIVEGVVAHNCEIILRPHGLCNLSEVIIRPEDTLEDLIEKVKVATIIGTMQAGLINFRYLRNVWRHNAEEEALLGVSLTGIMDHEVTSGLEGTHMLKEWLTKLKEVAIATNKKYSKKFGVNESVAITCVKPSGTVSQLVNSASGIHARFAKYYIRRVRASIDDPMTEFMVDSGIPHEPEINSPDTTMVFSFPMKAPEKSVCVNDISAIGQLEHWKLYQDYWCEHKPSVTIYVEEDEWMKVGAWVYKNFDYMSGVSFLPKSDHVYQQAPYEEITEEEYNEKMKNSRELSWGDLSKYEKEDRTVGSQEYACVSGACEI